MTLEQQAICPPSAPLPVAPGHTWERRSAPVSRSPVLLHIPPVALGTPDPAAVRPAAIVGKLTDGPVALAATAQFHRFGSANFVQQRSYISCRHTGPATIPVHNVGNKLRVLVSAGSGYHDRGTQAPHLGKEFTDLGTPIPFSWTISIGAPGAGTRTENDSHDVCLPQQSGSWPDCSLPWNSGKKWRGLEVVTSSL
jgi:hypothetical protein